MRARVLPLALTALLLCAHSAFGLQCHTCSRHNCSSEQPETCTGDSKCSTAVVKTFNEGRHSIDITKGCVPAQNCSSLSPVVWSFNFSVKALFAMNSCCDGDNCNAANGTETPVSDLPPELQQCHVCDPRSRRCRRTWCHPGEVCASARVPRRDRGAVSLYGCMTPNLCNGSMFEKHFGKRADSLTCCYDDNCNAPEEWWSWWMDDEAGWLESLFGGAEQMFYDSVFGGAERVLPLTLLLPLGFCTLLFNT